MSRKQAVCLSLLLLLVVLTQIAAVHNRARAAAASHQTFGRFTEEQALEMSRPIIANFLPPQNPIFLSADRMQFTLRDGRIHRQWCVDGTDRQNRSILHLNWDADTGQLREVGYDCRSFLNMSFLKSEHSNRMSAKCAVEKAQDWLGLLGFPETWTVSGPPKRYNCTWVVNLQGDRHKAMVTVFGLDGRLMYAGIEARH